MFYLFEASKRFWLNQLRSHLRHPEIPARRVDSFSTGVCHPYCNDS